IHQWFLVPGFFSCSSHAMEPPTTIALWTRFVTLPLEKSESQQTRRRVAARPRKTPVGPSRKKKSAPPHESQFAQAVYKHRDFPAPLRRRTLPRTRCKCALPSRHKTDRPYLQISAGQPPPCHSPHPSQQATPVHGSR